MPITLPQITLVRHGETAWSLSGQHTGRTDLALTDQGERAARALAPRLQSVRFAQVFTSPLQRARRTAELAGYSVIAQNDADLMEWDYGEYEGRRTVDIRAAHPAWDLFVDGCPGGETLDQVSSRADRVIARCRALASDVLLFAHRDLLRILIARWLALPALEGRRFTLSPTAISRLAYDHNLNEPLLQSLNENAYG